MDRIEVRTNHKFDYDKLVKYLKTNIADFNGQDETNFEISQFIFGQSNPTFLIILNGKKMVLRKKPPGSLLKGAHQVDREFNIISALFKVNFPVARPLLYCSDVSVIGTEFYVMDYVEGRIFRDMRLQSLSPDERNQVYSEYLKVMVQLHSIDVSKLNVPELSIKAGTYHERQIATWTRQYRASETQKISEMEELITWLPKTKLLGGDYNKSVGIIHGDLRIDNIIFANDSFKILAVLDWELCTVGHTIADLAYACQFNRIPLTLGLSLGNFDKGFYGIPSEVEFKQSYYQLMKLNEPPQEDWLFFLVLSVFRLASISQGVYKRSLQGNASAPNANTFLQTTKVLSKVGAELIQLTKYANKSGRINLLKQNTLFRFLGKEKFSDKFYEAYEKILDFMDRFIYPNERGLMNELQPILNKNGAQRWKHHPKIYDKLKEKAKQIGLFNLFLPSVSGLTNLEYAVICETFGRSFALAPEVFNCAAPDTGNMEVLHKYGSSWQKDKYLKPLLDGEIRSCFAMTEKGTPSSDATNIQTSIVFDPKTNEYVVNGRKWWISGAGDPRCEIAIVMGISPNKSRPRHSQHSMILVPMNHPNLKIVRPMMVFGYDDAPHGHMDMIFDNVRVPKDNIILGEGRGFEIAQGRLGPGRIHHCMRLIGMAERALDNLIDRSFTRKVFGKYLKDNDHVIQTIAKCRIEIEQARMLTLSAADKIDQVGAKYAKDEIAMIKVVAPNVALQVIDRAIQIHGAEGIGQDTCLPYAWVTARTLRLADGPDEVHLTSIGKSQIENFKPKF